MIDPETDRHKEREAEKLKTRSWVEWVSARSRGVEGWGVDPHLLRDEEERGLVHGTTAHAPSRYGGVAPDSSGSAQQAAPSMDYYRRRSARG